MVLTQNFSKDLKAKIIVRGRVQMVGFRYFVLQKALSLGIKGSVRNLSDGSVEVIALGEKEFFLDFLKELKQGPPGARVSETVMMDYEAPSKLPEGFRIEYR
ncbi:MAG: acylphosphatase [Elusimicrobia bacterium]|nr:acylphosphatase [Elusimicrobiota bacterium]